MERLTQKLQIQKRRLANYLENSFNGIFNIFHRSGPRAPDPDSDPETGSTSLFKTFYRQFCAVPTCLFTRCTRGPEMCSAKL